MYVFTTQWFKRSDIKMNLNNFIDKNKELHILEIGSYEGRSSCFFSDNYLSNCDSTLSCIDPFDTSDKTTNVTNEIKNRFLENINKSVNNKKCELHEMTSDNFFKTNTKTYDLIYIDGSHIPDDVQKDMINSFKVLKKDGIMWMDDYKLNKKITNIMNDFIENNKSELEVVFKNYQLAIKKINK